MNKLATPAKRTIHHKAHPAVVAMSANQAPTLRAVPPAPSKLTRAAKPASAPVEQSEPLTALPSRIDVAALAQLYNTPPASHVVREDLLDAARTALQKYELAEADFEIAADSLARSMHLLLEQHGLTKLEPHHMAALERDVLAWCGICQGLEREASPSDELPLELTLEDAEKDEVIQYTRKSKEP